MESIVIVLLKLHSFWNVLRVWELECAVKFTFVDTQFQNHTVVQKLLLVLLAWIWFFLFFQSCFEILRI